MLVTSESCDLGNGFSIICLYHKSARGYQLVRMHKDLCLPEWSSPLAVYMGLSYYL